MFLSPIEHQNKKVIPISVVIPTCNRKNRLLSLLSNLNSSTYPFLEIIITDSGEDKLTASEICEFSNSNIRYHCCEKSVCIQRNRGIELAAGTWVFLCDDDIEVPSNYIEKLISHITHHPNAGAVSGLVLQKVKDEWASMYSIKSDWLLLWTYIFHLSIWGEIHCGKYRLTRKISMLYKKRGNYISKAGWPVITDFSGEHFTTPLYGLGASLIRKDWLLKSQYDEVLDRHGIGDNFGVATGFPGKINVVNNAFVYHHEEHTNRLYKPLQYYRRVLALDYFRRHRPNLTIKKHFLVWSLLGNLLSFIIARDKKMSYACFKAIGTIVFFKNPYYEGHKNHEKIIEPKL